MTRTEVSQAGVHRLDILGADDLCLAEVVV